MKKKKNKKLKYDTRQTIDLKSQFKKVDTGIKNGVFIFSAPLTIEQIAQKLSKASSDILKFFFLKGKMKNINTILTEIEIGELCFEYNYDFEKRTEIDETNILSNLNFSDDEKNLVVRPPIVTVMGHVDHGKTTLLDYIRKANVVKGEAGGITQSIGAYQVPYKQNKITFIDTPGHAAFTEMRARGANITDIVVLVIAADDGIKQQTIEAIDHAKAASAQIIVFVNKCDKPNAKPDEALSRLTEFDLTAEEWGGQTITVKGSALTGDGVDKLLESIIAISEIEEHKANPNRLASGIVIESHLDKGLGSVASVIVQNGTLARGDMMIAGSSYGKVRAMFDDNGKQVSIAKPSQPVKITGLNAVPLAGDYFVISTNEKDIKQIAEKIRLHQLFKNNLENDLLSTEEKTGLKKLNIILKTDVNGSLEAIKNMLNKISIEGVKLTILRGAVGSISESDVELAKASKGVIVGFNVKPNKTVKDSAITQKINVYFYDIIYKLNEEIQMLMEGKLDPVYVEEETAECLVLQIWKHSKVGTIIGCMVTSGEVHRSDNARVLREGIVVCKTKISSLKHVKDDVNSIVSGKECGLTLDKYNDLKVGDVIQSYKEVQKK